MKSWERAGLAQVNEVREVLNCSRHWRSGKCIFEHKKWLCSVFETGRASPRAFRPALRRPGR